MIKPFWDLLYPLLIFKWRKLLDLPLGPEDRLQTREFRRLIESIAEYKKTGDLSSKDLLGAYFMYDWALQYAQGISLIQELPSTPTRVLDLGSHGAPFSLAALQHGAIEVLAVGDNTRALTYGAEICGHFSYPISIRTGDITNLAALSVGNEWDLIILSYSLFRHFPAREDQISYIKKLLPLLSAEGHLLIVEDSISDTNRRFLQLRDDIAKLDISILAPCLWKGACPALKHGKSPCFAQRPLDKPFMVKEIQRATSINLSSLKMSYLILRSPHAPIQSLPNKLYRVISPPVETFRGTRYMLCGVLGKKMLGTTLKEHPKHSKAYEYLKRGDVIAIDNPVGIEEDIQVTDKTIVQLKAPCDKPVLIEKE